MAKFSVDGQAIRQGKLTGKLILGGVALLLLLILAFSCFVIVPAGHTGVVVTLGKVSDRILSEGFHIKAPIVQQVEKVSNKIQVQEVESAAVSRDLQAVRSIIAVNYRVSLDASAKLFKNIGRDYQTVILLPNVQESMKSATAKYTAEELITKRAQVGEEVKTTLENKVSEYGIFIEKFNIVNFDFSADFNAAIEAKQVAEQNLLKTKTEQQQAIVIAEAEAKKQIIAAEAEAKAITAKAQAQADANNLLTKSLSQVLVEYQKIQKWDGKMPAVTGGNALISFDALQGNNTTAEP